MLKTFGMSKNVVIFYIHKRLIDDNMNNYHFDVLFSYNSQLHYTLASSTYTWITAAFKHLNRNSVMHCLTFFKEAKWDKPVFHEEIWRLKECVPCCLAQHDILSYLQTWFEFFHHHCSSGLGSIKRWVLLRICWCDNWHQVEPILNIYSWIPNLKLKYNIRNLTKYNSKSKL